MIADNPQVDIDDVVRVGDGQRVIGYTYESEKRETIYFDPEFAALSGVAWQGPPKSPMVDFVDSTRGWPQDADLRRQRQ